MLSNTSIATSTASSMSVSAVPRQVRFYTHLNTHISLIPNTSARSSIEITANAYDDPNYEVPSCSPKRVTIVADVRSPSRSREHHRRQALLRHAERGEASLVRAKQEGLITTLRKKWFTNDPKKPRLGELDLLKLAVYPYTGGIIERPSSESSCVDDSSIASVPIIWIPPPPIELADVIGPCPGTRKSAPESKLSQIVKKSKNLFSISPKKTKQNGPKRFRTSLPAMPSRFTENFEDIEPLPSLSSLRDDSGPRLSDCSGDLLAQVSSLGSVRSSVESTSLRSPLEDFHSAVSHTEKEERDSDSAFA
ncbi:hypothetical protein SAICODRAFT_28009 [Saitoella complicata NRRL Y-17804]|nr:uncharacterized protein SAICODRAFT_28009 [Saitoella complicata NRRL Y-17804]ODQ49847.1 hypothetical protein SAICODRAFT_28009 [Saitoella complicata NRRL Y-17804]